MMAPELKAFVVVTCAHHAVVGLTVFAAWILDSGAFLLVALLLAILGGYEYERPAPKVCPKCGHIIQAQKDGGQN